MSAASNGRTVMVQGRIVFVVGDLFKGRPKMHFGTQQPKLNQQGETMTEYGFGLAVPKSVLNQCAPGQPGEIWMAIHEEAYTMFPSRQIPPSFAMKYKDGDSAVDEQGVPYSQRKGYAGHLVFACTTNLPIKFFRFENGQNILINEGIKCGDYVNVQLSIKAHPAIGSGKAGLYMNPNAVQFLGYGEAIVNTPSGDQIFGAQAPPMPQGASPTPIAPQGMLIPTGAPPMVMPQQGYGQQPAPAGQWNAQAAPPVQQQQAPQPHYGVLPQAHQPQFQQPAAMPAPQFQQPPGMPPQVAPQGYGMPAPQQPPQFQQAVGMPAPAPQQAQYQPPNGMPAMPPANGYGSR